mgnify:CR=1 FL=1
MDIIKAGGVATMTSREIADLVESRHADVCRTIDRLLGKGVIGGCTPTTYTHEQNGQQYTEYRLDKRSSLVVVAQLCPEFTARIVDRWQELEAKEQGAFAIPKTMAEALRLAADQAELIEAQQAQIEAAKPAVEFVGKYVQATGLKGFREVCKLLKANEARFREFLMAEQIMYRLGGTLTAYQNHIDAGRFDVRTGVSDADHAFTTTKFTPKGIDWVAGRWGQWCLHNDQKAA